MYTTIYSKFSNERDPRLAVRTDILEDEQGNRIVRKLPEYPEGEAHVAALTHWYQVFSDSLMTCKGSSSIPGISRLSYNRCRPIPGGVELEYVDGKSLEDYLLSILHTRGVDACAEEFLQYLRFIRSIHTGAVFEPCEAFRTVFGEATLPAGTICAPYTNIDLLCENIRICDGAATIIDYEWSFDFPIPVNYLLYRIIFYFTTHAYRGEEFQSFDFHGKMGITKEEITAFESMETHFQHYITGAHIPVRDLYDDISDGYLQPNPSFVREDLQIYFDYGEGLSEKNSTLRHMQFGTYWYIQAKIPIPDGVQSLRVDPGYRAAMVHLTEFRFDNQSERAIFTLREGTIQGEWLYFSEDDPNILLPSIPYGAKSLLIELEIHRLDAMPLREINRLAKTEPERKNPFGRIRKSAKSFLKSE